MVKIIKAKQWYKWTEGWTDSSRSSITDIVSPKPPYTVEVLQTDTLYQGDHAGKEREVFHDKFDGTIIEAAPYVDHYGRTHIPSMNHIFPLMDSQQWSATETHCSVVAPYNYSHRFIEMEIIDKRGNYTFDAYDPTGKHTQHEVYGPLDTISPPSRPINPDNVSTACHRDVDTNFSMPEMEANSDVAQQLFTACCEGVFPLEMNNVENVKSIIDALLDLKEGLAGLAKGIDDLCQYFSERGVREILKSDEIPKKLLKKGISLETATTAWMAYRYQYTTTKSDIEEARRHLGSQIREWSRSEARKTRRMHSSILIDDTAYCMTVNITPRLSNEIEALWVRMRGVGLQPNLANLWDCVPLSFVVDWFAPIQNHLHHLDNMALFNKTHFVFGPILLSSKKTEILNTIYGPIKHTRYVRRLLAYTPQLKYEERKDPSRKTVTFRALDGASLIVGSLK